MKLQVNLEKASIICCQNELATLGGCDGVTPEQISGQLESLNHTLRRESRRHDTRLLIHIIIGGLHASSSSLSFFLSHTHTHSRIHSHTHTLYLHTHWIMFSLFFFFSADTLNLLRTWGCCMQKKNERLLKGSKFTKPFDRNWMYVLFGFVILALIHLLLLEIVKLFMCLLPKAIFYGLFHGFVYYVGCVYQFTIQLLFNEISVYLKGFCSVFILFKGFCISLWAS